MLEGGFVKIHRSLLSWEWYHNKNTCRLFLHLILTVNYEDKKWQGKIIKRGQRVTSLSKLASETDMTVREVRTALKNLKTTGEVTSESTSNYSIITIKNYDKFQDVTSEMTSERQASDKQSTSERQASDNNGRKIKKDKESKKEKEINNKESLSFDDVPLEILDDVKSFVEHRKALKAPMTQRALDLVITKLEKLAPGDYEKQNKILNKSIENGWKGVFELDNKGGNKHAKIDNRDIIPQMRNYEERQYDDDFFESLRGGK